MLFISFLYSPTLQVISMILLLLTAFVEVKKEAPFIKLFPNFRNKLQHFLNNKQFVVITLIFWITFFTFFNSSDKESWSFFITMKLPFLLLPFAAVNLPYFSKRDFQRIFLLFTGLVFFSSLSVTTLLFSDPENILVNISQGKAVETPIEHIKYSLLVSFAIMLGVIVFFDSKNTLSRLEKILLGAVSLYLFVFIHMLAVRSGLIILYINLLLYLGLYMVRQKLYIRGLFLALFLMTIPVVAYYTLPTFKEKLKYMILDFKMSQQDRGGAFSDGERIRSYEIGWELFSQSPLTGIGYGDIFKEYNDLYEVKYFAKSPTNLPHNQFLTMGVASGIVGILLFCIALFFPFFYRSAYKNPILVALQVLVLLAFLVENTIERQNGVGFYLVFLLLLLHQERSQTMLLPSSDEASE
jgi:O-antigen ligase